MPLCATRTSGANHAAHEALRDAIRARYTLLTKISDGNLTEVHLARPRGDGAGSARQVVLKYLKPEYTLRPEATQLLRQEARVSSKLYHAHLTSCVEMIESGDACCVVTNYVEGKNLAQLLEQESGTPKERYIVPLVVDVLEGLHAMHSALDAQGSALLLRHGAIRARHVLVGVDGSARLTDFSQTQGRRGTENAQTQRHPTDPQNMAPEQAVVPECGDPRSDIFLAGVMLWETLTGTSLFAAGSTSLTLHNLMHRPILPPSQAGLHPSASLDEICLRALNRNPHKRYASALDMASALRDAALNADLCASRKEIGEWVQSRLLDSDDEPTTRFVRPSYSDARELAPVARPANRSTPTVGDDPAARSRSCRTS